MRSCGEGRKVRRRQREQSDSWETESVQCQPCSLPEIPMDQWSQWGDCHQGKEGRRKLELTGHGVRETREERECGSHTGERAGGREEWWLHPLFNGM